MRADFNAVVKNIATKKTPRTDITNSNLEIEYATIRFCETSTILNTELKITIPINPEKVIYVFLETQSFRVEFERIVGTTYTAIQVEHSDIRKVQDRSTPEIVVLLTDFAE